MIAQRSLLSLTLAAIMIAVAACAPQAPNNDGNNNKDAVLTIATTSDVVNFNPTLGNSRTDNWVTNLMYPHLLTINNDGTKEKSLAVEWGYIDDTTGFYEIRDDMTWSDGKPVTANDVAYTLNAVKNDEPAGTFYGQLGSFESAKAVSQTRVEVKLNRPDSTIIDEIGFWGVVVPQHVFEPAGSIAKFANDGSKGGWVSAGPFQLTEVQVGQSYTLKRVDNYPLAENGRAAASSVVFRVYPDVNTEILALQSGEVNVIANALPPAQVEQLKNTPGIEVAEVPGLGYAHMVYNMHNKDLGKVEVRQALAHAVNLPAIREVALLGQAISTHSNPIMPVLTKYHEDLKEYEFDPTVSRSLLEGAGYKADAEGKFDLHFRLIYSLQDAVTSQWAQMVRDSAAEAGIEIELKGAERNTYLSMTDSGDYDIYAGNFAIMDDPVTSFALSYLPGGAINYTFVDDPKLNGLIEEAQKTFDEGQRIQLMQQAARIVHDQVYDNVMYTQNLYFAYNNKWTGFTVKPSELLSIIHPESLANAVPTTK